MCPTKFFIIFSRNISLSQFSQLCFRSFYRFPWWPIKVSRSVTLRAYSSTTSLTGFRTYISRFCTRFMTLYTLFPAAIPLFNSLFSWRASLTVEQWNQEKTRDCFKAVITKHIMFLMWYLPLPSGHYYFWVIFIYSESNLDVCFRWLLYYKEIIFQ